MLSLAEYQTQLARCLLAPADSLPPDLDPRISRAAAALGIHRNTILQALLNALRMTFPMVDRLVGEAAFNALATDYVREFPPTSAILYEYGQHFPDYLQGAVPEHGCLRDIARFDLRIDQVGRESAGVLGSRIGIAPGTTVRLARSVRCERFDYAVDSIRDAILAGRTDLSEQLRERSPRKLAVWRTTEGVSVRCLSDPALAFLEALILGRGAESALLTAIETCDTRKAIEAIQREVFASSFCQIVTSFKN